MSSTPKHRGFLRITTLSVVLISLATSAANAQPPPRASVRLTLDACPTLAGDRVRNILGAELGALLIAHDGDVATPALEVTVACDEAATTLTVRDPVTSTALVRRVALDEVHPLARERLVALAIAELVTAIGIELEAAEPIPEPEEEPVAPIEPVVESEPAVVAVSEPDLPRMRLSALFAVTWLGHPQRGAYGGRIRFDHLPHPLFGWAAALWAERSHFPTDLGRVTVSEFAVDLEATINRHWRHASLQGAAGGRCGLAILRGDSNDSDIVTGSFRAPLLAPHLAVRAFVRPARGFFIVVGTELSFIVVTAHALVDGMRVVSLDGAAFTAQLGVGFEL